MNGLVLAGDVGEDYEDFCALVLEDFSNGKILEERRCPFMSEELNLLDCNKIVIDEAQDWLVTEINLLRKLYPPSCLSLQMV